MFLRGGNRWLPSTQHPESGAARQHEDLRPATRPGHLGVGTLACSRCDAPVAIGTGPLHLTDGLACPFCDHRGRVRDFLSLASPSRPARVVIRVGHAP